MATQTRSIIVMSLLLLGGCNGEEAEATQASGTGAGEGTSSGALGDGVTDGGSSGTTTTSNSTTTATTGDIQESSTSGGDTSGGPRAGCEAYVSKFIECIADDNPELYREALEACEIGVLSYDELYGAECVDAVETYQACFSSLTCIEIEGERVCEAEASAMMKFCTSEPGPLCADYEAKVVACTGDPDSNAGVECQTHIDTYSTYYGEVCKQAVEDLYVCLTALSCDESGCESENEAIPDLCG